MLHRDREPFVIGNLFHFKIRANRDLLLFFFRQIIEVGIDRLQGLWTDAVLRPGEFLDRLLSYFEWELVEIHHIAR